MFSFLFVKRFIQLMMKFH